MIRTSGSPWKDKPHTTTKKVNNDASFFWHLIKTSGFPWKDKAYTTKKKNNDVSFLGTYEASTFNVNKCLYKIAQS